VQVEAASINPIDVRRRDGYGTKLFSLLGAARMPLVLGNDFAGTVCAVGHGVTTFREGDAVFGAKPPSSYGTHATHVAVRAEHALLQPTAVPAHVLAALPYNFLTVTRALAGAGITQESINGGNVLVHGASGGLGLLAVRLLNELGAHVTAVAGSGGLAACHAAGAAIVVDRHRKSLASLPRQFAATLNFANWDDEASLLRLLAPGAIGHATTVHPLLGNFDRFGLLAGAVATLRDKRRMRALAPNGACYAWTVFRPDRTALSALAARADALILPDVVGFPLGKAAEAHRHVEQRRPGRAVLLPQQQA
jgi:reticulon-4-interacting protein 1, mitochondrial